MNLLNVGTIPCDFNVIEPAKSGDASIDSMADDYDKYYIDCVSPSTSLEDIPYDERKGRRDTNKDTIEETEKDTANDEKEVTPEENQQESPKSTVIPTSCHLNKEKDEKGANIKTTTHDDKEASETPEQQQQESPKSTIIPTPQSINLPPLPSGKTKRITTVKKPKIKVSTKPKTPTPPKPTPINRNVRNKSLLSSRSTIQRPREIKKRSRMQTTGAISGSKCSYTATTEAINKRVHNSKSTTENQLNSLNFAKLWIAHNRGILPAFLKSTQNRKDNKDIDTEKIESNVNKEEEGIRSDDQTQSDTNHTNSTVCTSKGPDKSVSSASSWVEDEGGVGQYNCWQILKDEYAEDYYGFVIKDCGNTAATSSLTNITTLTGPDSRDPPNELLVGNDNEFVDDDSGDDDTSLRQFKILGTGADDLSAQPHVLSPPLMDSLLNFVPESHSSDNFWLKYSLLRDGSSLDTFREYTRAAPYTILAIQSTKGDVFGCFTTSPWETHARECFGNGESFVWKMRFNRNKMDCHSLYDQAHLESEIDIYPYSGFNDTVQLCTNNMIALGGSEVMTTSPLGFSYQNYQEQPTVTDENITNEKSTITSIATAATATSSVDFKYKNSEAGFAIALHDDLCRGTSSPCPTFCSPSLLSDGGEFFEVANLEVWAFTPCDSVDEAQKLEMRKYFISQTSTGLSPKSHIRSYSSSSTADFSSRDLVQGEFYRRLGEQHSYM